MSLPSFASSSSTPPAKHAHITSKHLPGPHSRTQPRKILPLLLVSRMEFFPLRQRVQKDPQIKRPGTHSRHFFHQYQPPWKRIRQTRVQIMVDLRRRGRGHTTSSTPGSTSATSVTTTEGWPHNYPTLLQSSSLPLPAPRVTCHDQQQQHPPPQQRVTIELLPDDTGSSQPTAPTITVLPPQQSAPLPPPPWTPFDIASVRGTALTTNSAAFTNPSTVDHAAELAARIHTLEDELRLSRDYYASN
jgi:hypothetical protein